MNNIFLKYFRLLPAVLVSISFGCDFLAVTTPPRPDKSLNDHQIVNSRADTVRLFFFFEPSFMTRTFDPVRRFAPGEVWSTKNIDSLEARHIEEGRNFLILFTIDSVRIETASGETTMRRMDYLQNKVECPNMYLDACWEFDEATRIRRYYIR